MKTLMIIGVCTALLIAGTLIVHYLFMFLFSTLNKTMDESLIGISFLSGAVPAFVYLMRNNEDR